MRSETQDDGTPKRSAAPWTELCLELPRGDLDAVSGVLFAHGCQGLQEDVPPELARPPRQLWDTGPAPPPPPRVLLRAWFQDPGRAAIEAALGPLLVPADARTLRWVQGERVDWGRRWQEAWPPLRISARLVLAPPWNAPAGALVIEPGQGFGTGEHPTTRALLLALERLAADPAADLNSVLDVGCGSGVLALAAARLGFVARGIDVDPAAVREAQRNAARNRLSVSFATTPLAELDAGADLVLANLHAELLVELAGDLVAHARRRLLLSGILPARERLVRAAFEPACGLLGRSEHAGWLCLDYRAPGLSSA